MIILISLLTLLGVSLYSLNYVVRGFNENRANGYSFFIPVFFLFYVFPVFTDFATGLGFRPFYRLINESLANSTTTIIYNFYISALLLLFIKHSKSLNSDLLNVYKENQIKIALGFIKIYQKYFTLLFIILAIPFVITLLYGDFTYYSTYNRVGLFDEIPESHGLIARLMLLNVILVAFLINTILLDKRIFGRNRTFLFPFLFIILIACFWIHGKRSIVANYIVIQYTFFIISKAVPNRIILRQLLVVLAIFIVFLVAYGKNIADNAIDTYYGFRLDFTRDYGVKYAIYNDLLLERHILPFDFASFLFNITFYIPRELWEAKPQPYAVYFTNSVFGNFGGDDSYGWGFTTSIFGEHISNLGWLGLLTAPWFVYLIFKIENKSSNPLFKLLSILIAVLLIVLHPIAFMVLLLLYFILLIRGDKRIIFK